MTVARRRLLRRLGTAVVLVAVTAFFADTLAGSWDEVRDAEVDLGAELVAAVVLFAVAVPLSGVLWGRIVTVLAGRRIGTADAIAVHCSSWLLKYVPGQVGSVLNKVAWGSRRGLSRTLVLLTFVYENVFLQLASIVPAVAILLAATGFGVFGANASAVLVPLLVLVPVAVVTNRRWFRAVLSVPARRILGQALPDELFLPTAETLRSLAAFTLPRILNGVGFVLVARAIAPVEAGEWLPLGAAYVLGGAIGILAVFVPSGLGVRESVTVVFAAEYLDGPDAVLAALLARLLTVVADVGVLGAYGAARWRARREEPEVPLEEVSAP